MYLDRKQTMFVIDLQERRNKILNQFCFGRNWKQILILEVFRDDRWRLQRKCRPMGQLPAARVDVFRDGRHHLGPVFEVLKVKDRWGW